MIYVDRLRYKVNTNVKSRHNGSWNRTTRKCLIDLINNTGGITIETISRFAFRDDQYYINVESLYRILKVSMPSAGVGSRVNLNTTVYIHRDCFYTNSRTIESPYD